MPGEHDLDTSRRVHLREAPCGHRHEQHEIAALFAPRRRLMGSATATGPSYAHGRVPLLRAFTICTSVSRAQRAHQRRAQLQPAEPPGDVRLLRKWLLYNPHPDKSARATSGGETGGLRVSTSVTRRGPGRPRPDHRAVRQQIGGRIGALRPATGGAVELTRVVRRWLEHAWAHCPRPATFTASQWIEYPAAAGRSRLAAPRPRYVRELGYAGASGQGGGGATYAVPAPRRRAGIEHDKAFADA